MNRGKKIIWVLIISVFIILVCTYYYRYEYVFGDGFKAGTMNYFVHKGYLFKTYEGKLIQTGLNSGQGGIQTNEFKFSVTDPKVAAQLDKRAGANLQVHYKEYFHTLPWRGVSAFIVDSVSVTP